MWGKSPIFYLAFQSLRAVMPLTFFFVTEGETTNVVAEDPVIWGNSKGQWKTRFHPFPRHVSNYCVLLQEETLFKDQWQIKIRQTRYFFFQRYILEKTLSKQTIGLLFYRQVNGYRDHETECFYLPNKNSDKMREKCSRALISIAQIPLTTEQLPDGTLKVTTATKSA